MTVFEYLQQLPQSLFEATLMGLMGIPFNPIQEAQFHEWMNSSYEKTFNAGKSIDPSLFMDAAETEALAILGREIQKPPQEKQIQLKEAMKSYCEVCDCINQSLVGAQKKNDGTNERLIL